MGEPVKVGLLLHFFQPWWQYSHVLDEINQRCYRPFWELVDKSDAGFIGTVNVHYTLLKYWSDKDPETFERFRSALYKNKIEYVSTALHHPIVPLLPDKEIVKQMYFDTYWKNQMRIRANSRGFYFPEMAYSRRSLDVVRGFGNKWTVLEDNVIAPDLVPFNYIYSYRGTALFLRSHHWSKYIFDWHMDFNTFDRRMSSELPNWIGRNKAYIVIATDAETFGHHNPGLGQSFLFPAISEWSKRGTLSRFESLAESFPLREVDGASLRETSWSTEEEDVKNGTPYPLWKSNSCHELMWRLLGIAFKYTDREEAFIDGLQMANSCHFWWVSRRPHFEPEIMWHGAWKAYNIVLRFGSEEDRAEVAKIVSAIKKECALVKK